MKSVATAILICLCLAADASAKDHPIAKVIKLIEGLKAKAIAQGKEEQVSYTKFEYWCSTTTDELKDAIADEKEKIEELEDKIAGLTKKKETLEKEIETLEDQIGELEASAKKAKEDRAAEAKLYDKADKDLESTIKAVDGCIKALEGAESSTEGAMLAQRHVKLVLSLLGMKATEQQRRVLENFAKPRPDQLAAGDLSKHTDKYDFKSENVIELLKQLKLKFEDDKLAGTTAETNAINAYELSKEARDNAIDAAKKSKKQKEKELGATEKAIADADKELKSTQSDLKADSKSLEETEDACRTKKVRVGDAF
jgi:chromosome segregation protein